jgi:hypothetical protein
MLDACRGPLCHEKMMRRHSTIALLPDLAVHVYSRKVFQHPVWRPWLQLVYIFLLDHNGNLR